MPLSRTQLEVANCDKRFRVLVCGRRWGKTTLAIREICKIARYPDKTVYLIFPSYRMARTVGWKKLKEKLLDLKWIKKVNETNLEITLKNGSLIALKGSENADSLRGVSLSAAVFDEFAFQDREVWETIIRPALADQQGPALFITTPVGKNNWAFDLFNMEHDFPNDWKSFTYTTLEGGFVSEEEIIAAKAQMSDREFKQEFEASFETYANNIYYAFSREQNVRPFSNPTPKDIYIGCDFNVGQMSAVCFNREGDQIHAFDEISLLSSNTDELVTEIRNRYPSQRIIIFPDPAGAARKTSASGSTDHSILRNAGFTVKVPNKHNPVRDGINAVNAKLCNANGKRTFFIDPKCKKTIESLEKHAYKEGTSIPDKDSGFDHFSDAFRYYIDYEFPIKREYEQLPPRTFAHRLA